MRTLIVGAGAVGGYFGGRMLQAGRDVAFLVRPARAAQLLAAGLTLQSPAGDFHHPHPPLVQAGELEGPYDLVLLSCKAYDLEEAVAAFAPAVGPGTRVVPLLNGMAHLDRLAERFGPEAVLGGYCLVSSALDADGRIRHLSPFHTLVCGTRDGSRPAGLEALAAEWSGCGFDLHVSDQILQEMWEKWLFIATLAGITCLMRAPVGDIVAAGGSLQVAQLLKECAAIAAAEGYPPRRAAVDRVLGLCTTPGSPLVASTLRDVERGGPTEAEHLLGDLLHRRGAPTDPASLLRAAYVHLAAYELRRARAGAQP